MYLPNSFKQNSFLPVSFRFPGGPPENEGRSAYWRMFFMQLQEEALKTEEPAVAVEAAEPVVELKKPSKKERLVRLLPKAEPTPLRIDPVLFSPSAYDQLADLPALPLRKHLSEASVRGIIDIEVERVKRRKVARRRTAAFLLMAA